MSSDPLKEKKMKEGTKGKVKEKKRKENNLFVYLIVISCHASIFLKVFLIVIVFFK